MKKLFFVFAFLIPLITHAQTTKTDVLVIGNGNAAFAAGVQASISGVNTIVLTQSDGFKLSDLLKQDSTEVIKSFKKRARKSLNIKDNAVLPEITNQIANAVIKKWSDSAKLFKVINNMPFYEIKRSGSGWEAKLTRDKSIKAKVLVLVDNPEKVLTALKLNELKPAKETALNYNETTYRTSISGQGNPNAHFLSLYSLLIPNQDNILFINSGQFEIGQATGATAAFAAFYGKKTSESNLKAIQGELLNYKLSLMPFDDVKVADSNWLAIQKVGITGIIKAELNTGKASFNPEKEITYNEVKQPIKDYYYKAQIWFDDHKDVPLNLEHTISLVSYVGNKAVDATKTEIEKKWTKSYRFKSRFDLKKNLSRREFAVIINDYLKPFDSITVDKTGRVIR
ncbi:hypothetical protein [Pedobacter sp.]|uniref:hypothetical protein n=1 Tax=Pedobacter sp. TaxID=1411316 RepID=UPI003BAD1F1F